MTAARKYSPARNPGLAKIAIAKRDLRLDDDDYRDMLERVTGARSAKDLTDAQIGRVLDDLKTRGWTPKILAASTLPQPAAGARKARPARASHPSAGKARAMWISLYQLGVVRDGRETALEAFARRQLKVDRLQWADQGQVYKLIEALKAMAERAGWEQWLDQIPPRNQVRELLRRLAVQQARRLEAAGVETPPISDLTGGQPDYLRAVITAMGEQIRSLPEE